MLLILGMLLGYFRESLGIIGQSTAIISFLDPRMILLIFIPVLIFESGTFSSNISLQLRLACFQKIHAQHLHLGRSRRSLGCHLDRCCVQVCFALSWWGTRLVPGNDVRMHSVGNRPRGSHNITEGFRSQRQVQHSDRRRIVDQQWYFNGVLHSVFGLDQEQVRVIFRRFA